MYRFVDQPLDSQPDGARFLIWAMRQWVVAAVDGRCACGVLRAAFVGMGVERAAGDFHVAMRTLCNNTLIPLRFGAVDRVDITEHEAVLIATAVAVAERDDAAMAAIARQLVHADRAARFARSFAGVAGAFTGAGLPFAAPVNSPGSR